jgi:hypothetical protein
MNTKATFAILGIAAVLALVVATTLSSSAYAALTTTCTSPGNSGCNDNNINSGPHDLTTSNSGSKNHEPPGQQTPERDDP